MSRLSDLLRTLEQLNPQLAKDLDDEIRPLQKRLPFGLNFERHAPEAVELAGHRIRKTNKVRVLPPRGSTERGDQRLWHVDSVSGGVAEVSTPNGEDRETQSVPVEDLILVAEFRDRIYPGLRPGGTVEQGGDKPFHTVINGENFHVLELLTFTHEHSVDAIYIDPPYNSGSRDWKYNNDYVEGDDLYRHSKWLAFMERRLKLAKRLLKTEDSGAPQQPPAESGTEAVRPCARPCQKGACAKPATPSLHRDQPAPAGTPTAEAPPREGY